MSEPLASSPESTVAVERTKPHRLTLLKWFKSKRNHPPPSSIASDRRASSISPQLLHTPLSRPSSIAGVHEALPDSVIEANFDNLYQTIVAHVHNYYSTDEVKKCASRLTIAHATTGLTVPWPQTLSLLDDAKTRLGTLAMCIGWTILSRTLLLKLGLSNSPGSTFLPPEIVECFQSFSIGKGAMTLDIEEPIQVNLALLSRWKQISAALMHNTYVKDGFSHFDPRTVNIERALNDLDPLLCIYATPQSNSSSSSLHDARLSDLREVLRSGARFAFTLFSQPSFWRFDWLTEHGDQKDVEYGNTRGFEEVARDGGQGLRHEASMGSGSGFKPDQLVIWPALLRVMDEDGQRVEGDGEGVVLGKRRHLDEFL